MTCFPFPISIVKELNGNVFIYNNDTGDFVKSLSSDIIKIECNENGIVKVIMDNGSVEYFDPALVVDTQILPGASIPFVGNCLDLSQLLATDFFFELTSGGGVSAIEIQLAASDETTSLTTGSSKVTFRTPCAFTLTEVRASLTTAQTSGLIFTVDINENGTSILSTKLTIDNTEKTSKTALTPAVISDSSLADDSEITIDIDQIGDGTAKGLKITLIGYR
jgi:hypothetical protein